MSTVEANFTPSYSSLGSSVFPMLHQDKKVEPIRLKLPRNITNVLRLFFFYSKVKFKQVIEDDHGRSSVIRVIYHPKRSETKPS